jgi:hypothetical protein
MDAETSLSPSTSSLSYDLYDQAASDHDWLHELSDEWISNPPSSNDGSTRGMSLRSQFVSGNTRGIETIPEEPETSTVRIVLGESDAQNTPEWKRRLEETKGTKDLFSPCHLEELFKEDTTRYRRRRERADVGLGSLRNLRRPK